MLPAADTGRSLYLAPNKVPKWSLRAFSCWVLISFIPYCAASSRSKEVAWISSVDEIFSGWVIEMQPDSLHCFHRTSALNDTLNGNGIHTVSFNRKLGVGGDGIKMNIRRLPKQILLSEKNIWWETWLIFSLPDNLENCDQRLISECTFRHKVGFDPYISSMKPKSLQWYI